MTYEEYHKAVVEEIVSRCGEECRGFFDSCTYHDEYESGEPVEDVAEANIDAADWEAP